MQAGGDGASKFQSWGGRRGLNPQRPEPQSGALPIELLPPFDSDYSNWGESCQRWPASENRERRQAGAGKGTRSLVPISSKVRAHSRPAVCGRAPQRLSLILNACGTAEVVLFPG